MSELTKILDKYRGFYENTARDDAHMTSMKILQLSRPPTPLVHHRPKFFHPLDLGRPISKFQTNLAKDLANCIYECLKQITFPNQAKNSRYNAYI